MVDCCFRFQYTNWLQRDNSMLNARALDAAISDYHFVCPSNLFALYYSLKGENVYMYYFTQRWVLEGCLVDVGRVIWWVLEGLFGGC